MSLQSFGTGLHLILPVEKQTGKTKQTPRFCTWPAFASNFYFFLQTQTCNFAGVQSRTARVKECEQQCMFHPLLGLQI